MLGLFGVWSLPWAGFGGDGGRHVPDLGAFAASTRLRSFALNGQRVETLGLVPTESAPALAGFSKSREMLAMPGRAGSLASNYATVAPRVLRFVHTTSRQLTIAARKVLLDNLSELLTGAIEITSASGNARKLLGYCRVYDASVGSPAWVEIPPNIIVEIECPNASYYDSDASNVVLGSGPVAIPVGTAAHQGAFLIKGPNTTAFTITYRNVSGTVKGIVAGTPVLGSGERLVIDLDSEQWVKYDIDNVATLVQSWDTGTTLRVIYPRDANRAAGLYATLDSDVDCVYKFRCNWEN